MPEEANEYGSEEDIHYSDKQAEEESELESEEMNNNELNDEAKRQEADKTFLENEPEFQLETSDSISENEPEEFELEISPSMREEERDFQEMDSTLEHNNTPTIDLENAEEEILEDEVRREERGETNHEAYDRINQEEKENEIGFREMNEDFDLGEGEEGEIITSQGVSDLIDEITSSSPEAFEGEREELRDRIKEFKDQDGSEDLEELVDRLYEDEKKEELSKKDEI